MNPDPKMNKEEMLRWSRAVVIPKTSPDGEGWITTEVGAVILDCPRNTAVNRLNAGVKTGHIETQKVGRRRFYRLKEQHESN